VSLLARWFYGKPRVGEIFFREGATRSSTGGAGGCGVCRDTIGAGAP